jgi:single-stranded DNA-specific DHH superfamily exonuclease
MQLNNLEHLLPESEFNADLETLTGVLGGLAANSRLLPDVHGTIFTGYEHKDLIKISGRINPSFGQEYHLGDLMNDSHSVAGITLGGGGHPGAASTVMQKSNKERFFDYVSERGI